MINLTIYLLVLAILLIVIKLIINSIVWEKILGLNLITGKIVLIILLIGVESDNMFFLDIALTFSIVGFISIALLTRFLSRGGRQK